MLMKAFSFLVLVGAAAARAQTPCVNGAAGPYPCSNVDLLGHMTLTQLGTNTNVADCWGWTDPLNGKEYAIVGGRTGTSFVDISTPTAPVLVGFLPAHNNVASLWRDVDTHGNWCFIGSEAAGHGLQVFDLTRLRNVAAPPQTFSADARYAGFGNSHSIYVDKTEPYVYAVGTGIAAALRVKARKAGLGQSAVRVIAQGGDGGTTDIGFGCLSGMFERNDDVLYICYDNEAYMNTGVQRSGATPPAARTATTQAVGADPGNVFGQGKDLPRIAMAHEIPYVATATVADLHDLEAKVTRAMSMRGARYIHVMVPCPLGWGTASCDTIKIARLATQSGLWPVFEAEYGEVVASTPIRRQVPVEDYLKGQKRFAHLFNPVRRDEVIDRLQAQADRNIRRYGLLPEAVSPTLPPIAEEANT